MSLGFPGATSVPGEILAIDAFLDSLRGKESLSNTRTTDSGRSFPNSSEIANVYKKSEQEKTHSASHSIGWVKSVKEIDPTLESLMQRLEKVQKAVKQ